METVSHQLDLTNENAESILKENGLNSNVVVWSLSKKKTGYGHWEISCELIKSDDITDNLMVSATTTNSQLIDEWNEEEDYFEDDGGWFDSVEDVMNNAFEIVVKSEYNQERINDWNKPV